jgi:hypothetical protein
MSPQKLDSLVIPDANLTCEEHAFKNVHVLSRDPLVVYIEGFLGEREADEVVELRYVYYICFVCVNERFSSFVSATLCSNLQLSGLLEKNASTRRSDTQVKHLFHARTQSNV